MNLIPPNKLKCDLCGKLAVWFYGPGTANFCDDCVPRGCSCNQDLQPGLDFEDPAVYSNPDNYTETLDEKGRRYPCCEYFYNPEGWPDRTTIPDILQTFYDKDTKKQRT